MSCIFDWRKMGKFKQHTIKYRITLSFVLCIIIPFIAFFIAFFRVSSNYAKKMSIQYLTSNLYTMQQQMEDVCNTYRNLSMMVYYNGDIDIVSSTHASEDEIEEVNSSLNNLVNSTKGLSSIFLVAEDRTYFAGNNFQKMPQYFKANQQKVDAADGRIIWLPVQEFGSYIGKAEKKFVAARSLYSANHVKIGTLWMVLDASLLENIFYNNNFLNGSTTYLIDYGGNVSLSTESSEELEKFNIDILELDNKVKQKSFFKNVDGKKSLVVYTVSYDINWICLSITPYSKILKDFSSITILFWIFICVYIIFIFIMFRILNNNIYLPIKILIKGVDKIASGDFKVKIDSNCEGEMKKLTNHFNRMVDKISSLLQQVKEEEQEKNDYKMQALMMQMSPHFIYNSLNTIKWIAVINKQDNIRNLIESLIKIFMSMTKKTNDNNTIKDEIELLNSYINIQKARYSNFDVVFQIDENVENLKIKKFLLQPIVENCIIHGISDGNINGKIMIRITRNQYLYIEIEDNGKGFEVAELDGKIEKNNTLHTKIGIYNINQIINLEYGEKYGIKVESEIGKGTKVSFTLPIIEADSVTESI